MNRLIATLAVSSALAFLGAGAALAQDLVITNARIITGTGQVIEKGSVAIKAGRIAFVGPGAAPATKGAKVVDGAGKTVIAGYIDAHRHVARGGDNQEDYFKTVAPKAMMDLLASGVTTVQEGGSTASIELKKRIESGQLKGPRIVSAYQLPVYRMKDEAEVRAAVDAAKASGADSISEVHYPNQDPPAKSTEQEDRLFKAAADEAAKVGIPMQVHAVAVYASVGAVRLGAKKLIHTPHAAWMTDAEAKEIAATGAQVSSCTGFGAPVFDVFNHENKPTFRDGKPWPEGILNGEGRGREAGYKAVNGRTLFDNGVTYGYCTDTGFDPKAALAHELKVLNLMFSPVDLVKILGPNSAAIIDRSKDLGTIEVGKLGDVLVLAGNPLDGYWYFLDPLVVIKGGEIMVDNRGKPNAGKPMGRAS